jgi:hypothetical protein
MIAANLRKHPDAMLRQLELELVATGGEPTQHAAFKTWLMESCTVRTIVRVVPAWFRAMKKKARELARAVKNACRSIIELQDAGPFNG